MENRENNIENKAVDSNQNGKLPLKVMRLLLVLYIRNCFKILPLFNADSLAISTRTEIVERNRYGLGLSGLLTAASYRFPYTNYNLSTKVGIHFTNFII